MTSYDQESMTDTVLASARPKKLILLIKLHDQVLFLAPLIPPIVPEANSFEITLSFIVKIVHFSLLFNII